LFVIIVLCNRSKIPPPGSSWCEVGGKYPAQPRVSEQLHDLFACDVDRPGSAICSFSFSIFVLLLILVIVFIFIIFFFVIIIFAVAVIVGKFEGDLNPAQIARSICDSIRVKNGDC
jgi:hypothetical protein